MSFRHINPASPYGSASPRIPSPELSTNPHATPSRSVAPGDPISTPLIHLSSSHSPNPSASHTTPTDVSPAASLTPELREHAFDLADDLWEILFAEVKWMYFHFSAAFGEDTEYECAPLPAILDMALQAIGMCIGASTSFIGNGSETRVRLHRPASSELFPEPDDFDAMAQEILNEAMLTHVASEEALRREEVARAEAARVEEARKARKKRAERLAQTRARRERLRALRTGAAHTDQVTPLRSSARLAAKRKRTDDDHSSDEQRSRKRIEAAPDATLAESCSEAGASTKMERPMINDTYLRNIIRRGRSAQCPTRLRRNSDGVTEGRIEGPQRVLAKKQREDKKG